MRILKNKTNFNFIGRRHPAIFISSVLNIAVLVGIAIFGFNFGVDFAGGTVVELKFGSATSAEEVREGAVKGGLQEPTVQGIGDANDNSFILRMGGTTQLTEESEAAAEVALRALGEVVSASKDLDNGLINIRFKARADENAIRAAVESSGTGVKEVRSMGEGAGGFDYQVVAAGMADKVTAALKAGLAKDFEVRRIDYVGPQVGEQLRNKGIMAMLYAMVAILIYVAFRFDLKFGPGALLSMLHDVVMVAGYFLITRREFNLTSIAALLTIIGYSVNDTIVIYDRIREEMVKYKGKPLAEIINIAINDTLARTILTSGTTALALVGLLVYGVGEIFDFAAAMLVGVLVGSYSSIFIASPLVLWLDEREQRQAKGGSVGAAKARPA